MSGDPSSALLVVPLTLAEANAYVDGLDDGWTLEVLRVCTEGEPNACSMLYATGDGPTDDGNADDPLVNGRALSPAQRPDDRAQVQRRRACWRACRALGYRKVITYTRADEAGTSLKAAGWRVVGEVKAETAYASCAPRIDRDDRQARLRWEPMAA